MGAIIDIAGLACSFVGVVMMCRYSLPFHLPQISTPLRPAWLTPWSPTPSQHRRPPRLRSPRRPGLIWPPRLIAGRPFLLHKVWAGSVSPLDRPHQTDWSGSMSEHPICSIPGCNKKTKYRSGVLCNMHVARKRLGNREMNAPPHRDIEGARRFLAQAMEMRTDECIIWPFSRNAHGYATGTKRHGTCIISRQVCFDTNGQPRSPKMDAAHSCGNGHLGCVNSRHLSWKTKQENSDDSKRHGTLVRGSKQPNSKLVEGQVSEILRLIDSGVTQKKIAVMFGVSGSTISSINLGKKWRHVQVDDFGQCSTQ